MNWLTKMFTSSIGQKLLVAVTGLFLCTFLIVHVSGNFQLFKNDNGMSFNLYSVFMTTNPLIKTVSYVLYVSILFHAFKGLHLAYTNIKARPSSYAMVNGKANSHWTSRSMGVLGTIILVFIVVHMSNFWFEYKFGAVPYVQYAENIKTGEVSVADYQPIHDKMEEWVDGDIKYIIVKDIYTIVATSFKNPFITLLYVISMGALGFHLLHGFKSGFQTLGINHQKYNQAIAFLSTWVFAILIPIAFASMPLYFFFK
jgi:succinate dehydrogenase / fumarate reductase cytochrome b subunit